MKKLILMSLVVSGFSLSALASHPHDRVCVSVAPANFVFQYSVGRTYQDGDPNKDPHEIAAEALRSPGDYLDNPGVKFTSEPFIFTTETLIPMTLKAKDGSILFKGTFDRTQETLTGSFVTFDGQSTTGTSKLTCISQPRVTLESSPDDIIGQ